MKMLRRVGGGGGADILYVYSGALKIGEVKGRA